MSRYFNKNSVITIGGIFASLAIIYYAVFNLHFIYTLDGDNAPQTYALYQFVAKALLAGELPLWNPYVCGGLSNVGSTITEAFYPINWIISLLFYDRSTDLVSYAIIPVNIFIHISLYFIGLFFLQKEMGVRQPLVRCIIGLSSVFSYSFCIHFFNATWYSLIDTVSWYPLILLFSLKTMRTESFVSSIKYICLLGLAFSMQALLGIGPTMILIAMSVFALFIIDGVYSKRIMHNVARITMAGGLGIILALPVLLCVVRFSSHCARYVDDLGGYIYGGLRVPYDSFVKQKVSFDNLTQMFDFQSNRSFMSLGIILLIFSVFGCFFIIKSDNNKSVKTWATFNLFYSLFYCLAFLVCDYVYYVPFLNSMREPFLYSIFLAIYATILTILFVSEITNTPDGDLGIKKLLKEKIIAPQAFCVVMAVVLTYNLLPRNFTIVELVMTVLLFAVCIAFLKKKRLVSQLAFVILGIISLCISLNSIDSIVVGDLDINEKEAIPIVADVAEYNRSIIDEIIKDKQPKIQFFGDTSPSNLGAVIGLKDIFGYFNPIPDLSARSYMIMAHQKRNALLNVKYLFINETDQDMDVFMNSLYGDGIQLIGEPELYTSFSSDEKKKIKIYEILSSDIYGWIGKGVELYSRKAVGDENMISIINDAGFDVKTKTYLNIDGLSKKEINAIETSADENVFWSEFVLDNESYNKKSYHITGSSGGILVITEFYDPGWKVYVDGKKSKLLNVNYTSMGVLIPEGDHKIVLTYRPTEFVIGSLVLGIVLSLLILIAILNKMGVHIEWKLSHRFQEMIHC